MNTYMTFPTAAEARTYRHEHGTGGWIFAPDPPQDGRTYSHYEGAAVLFPPSVMPHAILRHPFTRGRSGRLIGA